MPGAVHTNILWTLPALGGKPRRCVKNSVNADLVSMSLRLASLTLRVRLG